MSLFQLGQPASRELAILAEEGNPAPLAAALLANPAVGTVVTGSGLTNPGATTTLVLQGRGGFPRLSVAAMLIPTNDAFFAVNGVVYVLYTILSGEWRYLVPDRASFREAVLVMLHDLHLYKGTLPVKKFNGAQQIAYTAVVLMGAGSLLTGLAIYKPAQLAWLTSLCGGYRAARLEHFLLTLGYLGFFVIHVSQVLKAGWNNFRAMVSGYELVSEPIAEEVPHD